MKKCLSTTSSYDVFYVKVFIELGILELEQVGLVAVAKGKSGSKVRLKLLGATDVFDQGSVDRLLEGSSLGGHGGDLDGGLLLGGDIALEKRISNLANIHTSDRHLGARGNNVLLVDTAKRHTVEGVGA